jgi:solute carrier family 25 carnitine/acylcarnitine transporter 20/29
MRLAGLLAAVLASLATLPADSAALDQQLEQLPLLLSCSPPLERDPPPIGTTTSTLIDVLSADADYSTLLRLLQRTQLVPALNALANGTLLAPTNAAFEAAGYPGGPSQGSLADWAWSPFDSLEQDNLLRATRDRLLYHVLNHSLPLDPLEAERPPGNDSAKPHPRPSPPPPEEVACRPRFPPVGGLPESLETLLYPRRPGGDDRPEKPGPWLPAPHGQLGREGQRVRGVWRSRESAELGEPDKTEGDDWVGVDGRGRGGVRVAARPVVAGNGVVLKIDGVLDLPEDIGARPTVVLRCPV